MSGVSCRTFIIVTILVIFISLIYFSERIAAPCDTELLCRSVFLCSQDALKEMRVWMCNFFLFSFALCVRVVMCASSRLLPLSNYRFHEAEAYPLFYVAFWVW